MSTKNLHTHIYKPNVIFSTVFKPKKQENKSLYISTLQLNSIGGDNKLINIGAWNKFFK